ncbi:MAG: sensor domain-containing diguanylate cyclase [Oleispira sp.]
MPAANMTDNEQQRLDALTELGILYTPLESRFDRITRTICRIFYMPIAYISLIDKETQWIKSVQGLDLIDSPRNTSICAHTLLVDEYIICEDLTQDDRFKDNPFVVEGLKLRFYAGFTLKSRGQNVGTLCVIDDKPRKFSQEDIATMRDLVFWAQTEVNLTQLSDVQVQLITELDQAQRDAKIDGLTNLWNQVTIKDILRRAHHRHLLKEHPYTLMMVDIDNFKAINDNHGHPFGDQIIQSVADSLRTSLRPSDAIGRYGGDEFLVILENCPHKRAEELAQRLLSHIHGLTFISKGEKVNCSISIGLASTDHIELDSPEALLEHADQSLYLAKQSGRDCARG